MSLPCLFIEVKSCGTSFISLVISSMKKIYVGVHSTWKLDGYLGLGISIQKAIKKYGKENFERIILHYCLSREDVLEWEACIVDEHFLSRIDTYNLTLGGKYTSTHSIESKNKISKNSAKNAPYKGKTYEEMFGLEEAKRRKEEISKRAKNFKHTEETKEKMRKPKTSKRAPMSEEQKLLRSKAMKGRQFSEEHRNNISASAKARKVAQRTPCSDSRKQKLREYQQNRKMLIVFLALDLSIKCRYHQYQQV